MKGDLDRVHVLRTRLGIAVLRLPRVPDNLCCACAPQSSLVSCSPQLLSPFLKIGIYIYIHIYTSDKHSLVSVYLLQKFQVCLEKETK